MLFHGADKFLAGTKPSEKRKFKFLLDIESDGGNLIAKNPKILNLDASELIGGSVSSGTSIDESLFRSTTSSVTDATKGGSFGQYKGSLSEGLTFKSLENSVAKFCTTWQDPVFPSPVYVGDLNDNGRLPSPEVYGESEDEKWATVDELFPPSDDDSSIEPTKNGADKVNFNRIYDHFKNRTTLHKRKADVINLTMDDDHKSKWPRTRKLAGTTKEWAIDLTYSD